MVLFDATTDDEPEPERRPTRRHAHPEAGRAVLAAVSELLEAGETATVRAVGSAVWLSESAARAVLLRLVADGQLATGAPAGRAVTFVLAAGDEASA